MSHLEVRRDLKSPKGHNFYEHNGCLTFISQVNMPKGVSPSGFSLIRVCSLDNVNLKGEVGVGRRARRRRNLSVAPPPRHFKAPHLGTPPANAAS